MKLLDKKNIDVLKSSEKKFEIDEGLKLARKIDTLREISAKEEVNLSKFRTETLKNIKNEIDVLISEKISLQKNIDVLDKERKLLTVPLDEEWGEIKKEKEEILKEREDNAVNKSNLIQLDSIYRNHNDSLKIEIARIGDMKEKVLAEYSIAEQLKNEATAILNDSTRRLNESISSIKDRESELFQREKTVEILSRDNENMKQILKIKEIDLINKEKAINDKYQTLLRTEQRLKK